MEFLYEDSQIIVCYKESGLPVQSARVGTKDMVSILKNYLSEQAQNQEKQGGEEPYLGVIHRLDQPVEGVLVFAKTPGAAKELSAQVADGRMKKIYHAVVHWAGKDQSVEGQLTDYLLKEGKSNSSRIVSENTKGAKKAELYYKLLKVLEQTALAEIHLFTGRHHQIRVQMANAGMPLYGDRKYGIVPEFSEISGTSETSGAFVHAPLALCAVSLELFHPKTGKKMKFSCEPQGEYFRLF